MPKGKAPAIPVAPTIELVACEMPILLAKVCAGLRILLCMLLLLVIVPLVIVPLVIGDILPLFIEALVGDIVPLLVIVPLDIGDILPLFMVLV